MSALLQKIRARWSQVGSWCWISVLINATHSASWADELAQAKTPTAATLPTTAGTSIAEQLLADLQKVKFTQQTTLLILALIAIVMLALIAWFLRISKHERRKPNPLSTDKSHKLNRHARAPARLTAELHRSHTSINYPEYRSGQKTPASPATPGTASSPYQTSARNLYHTKVDDRIQSTVANHPPLIDELEQAQLLIDLELYDQAIVILTQRIRDSDQPSPSAWLSLFEIYAKTNRRTQYEVLAQGFYKLFNAHIPPWDEKHLTLDKHLEDYPAVLTNIQDLWGMAACRRFIESLLHDDRGGSRQGFTLAAYRDLLFLLDIIASLASIDQEKQQQQAIAQKLQAT